MDYKFNVFYKRIFKHIGDESYIYIINDNVYWVKYPSNLWKECNYGVANMLKIVHYIEEIPYMNTTLYRLLNDGLPNE